MDIKKIIISVSNYTYYVNATFTLLVNSNAKSDNFCKFEEVFIEIFGSYVIFRTLDIITEQ